MTDMYFVKQSSSATTGAMFRVSGLGFLPLGRDLVFY